MPWLLAFACLAGAGAASAGCAGCTVPIPFDVERSTTLVLPLGPVDRGCADAASGDDGADGIDGVRVDGVDASFTHERVDGVCRISARWSGPLLDMQDIKDDAEAQVHDAGANLADTEIDELGIDVDHVGLRDLDGGAAIDDAGLARLSARVNLLGHDDALVIGGDDPTHPDVTVDTGGGLLRRLNTAFDQGDDVDGDGTCLVEQDMDRIDALAQAAAPAMVIDFTIRVKGTAHATLGAGGDGG